MAVRKSASEISTRDAVFAAAARLFSSRGFDGVSMDDLARDAGVNKAMIYYHFAGKLALYRTIVSDGLQAMNATIGALAASADPPPLQLDRFIEAFVHMT
jgi:TetR/AcrR family transcriptional regulator